MYVYINIYSSAARRADDLAERGRRLFGDYIFRWSIIFTDYTFPLRRFSRTRVREQQDNNNNNNPRFECAKKYDKSIER